MAAVVQPRVVRRAVYRVLQFDPSVTGPPMLRQHRFPGWPKSCEGQATLVTGVATNAIGAITGMFPVISVTPAPTTGNGPEAMGTEPVVATVTPPFASRDFPTVTLRWELT